jgi:spoIIIJ-associated protein
MNERTTLEKIASTVEEAVEEGLSELGLPADAVDVEVLDSGSRGLFGVGHRQARVRLTIKPLSSATEPAASVGDLSAPVEADGDARLLDIARQTVTDILDKMKITAFVDAHFGEKEADEESHPILVDIHGDDLTVLIGRRAEILNSLQYIVNLIVSKQAERWVQITIDVEGYRARRERQLRQMARRMADQSVKTGRRLALEPMPASERRIIHIELRNRPDVTTQSVGEEPSRKVTIVPK